MNISEEFGKGALTPLREALRAYPTTDWHKPVIGRYHVSQLPMCLYKQYLSFQVGGWEEEGFVPAKSPTAWAGSLIHEGISRDIIPRLKEVFTPLISEHPIFYGLNDCPGAMIVGKIDLLVQMPDGELALVDTKSLQRLYYVREEGPSEHYIRQLSTYQGIMNIRRGYLWYIGLGDQLEEELIRCDFCPEAFDFIRGSAKLLHSCLVSNTPPSAVPRYGWECVSRRYRCPYFGRECPRFNSKGDLAVDLQPGGNAK